MTAFRPGLLLLAGLMLALTACGPRLVKGKAPFLSISSLAIEDDRLSASFSIRNINDVVMDIDAIEITIRIAGAELTRYATGLALSVDPNATE